VDLSNELKFFMDQGPMFCAATASVGLGGTLLISAVSGWLRRRISGLSPRLDLLRRRPATAEKASTIEVDETGYTLNGPPPALRTEVVETADPATSQRLEELLNRLREAGDRLENALEIPETTDAAYSALKSSGQNVEIETRVGVG